MAQSKKLRLPEGAPAALDQTEKSNQDLAKWLVYTTNVDSSLANEVCHEAMKAYNETNLHVPESEWDEMGFAKPADSSAEDVQGALYLHIGTVQRVLDRQQSDPWNVNRLYPSGLVVVDGKDWSEKGVIVVHCDQDEESGEWSVLQHRFHVKDLGVVLMTVLDADDTFERVAEEHGIKGL
ncbi:hypothetical protein CLAFUW4_08642 [Fulvia fulva]|uniref:Uncharacterized protein n=1 Tax=Passalora fulva TaxID=5499 RepID=A0A9Q8LDM2_PASFU|nr:uncharacterized protein CLAFUR5_08741 [Fulvia fulva]KAK4629043.1 hypothetical protein CLAFUR4_08644 [Fulvia fulva]KAK4630244.1 hypothetical protein CLAFUR0_08640 [Fulvia fulva]UJO15560.1 hypothetical protein CLAFUR5_08741 [Fulvia fulva]WPV12038.1 hypothetical protein CLAFUW4_08642 [Fulvia fulva]WPV27634.1 hypothetical protein CLAFUW7_08639 [Fulvia fulva]